MFFPSCDRPSFTLRPVTAHDKINIPSPYIFLHYSVPQGYAKHRALLPILGNKEVRWTVMALWKSYLAGCKFDSRGRNAKMLFRNVRYVRFSIAAERVIKPFVNWLGLLHRNDCTYMFPTHAVATYPPDGTIAVHGPRARYDNDAGVMP